MKHLKSYRIQFSGLSIGKHAFDFDIDKKFFDCYPYSIVKDGDISVKVILDKQPGMMIADFVIGGTIRLACDVCLQESDRPVKIEATLLLKFMEEDVSEITDDILVLQKQDFEFSIADFLYEHINLSVPHYVRCDQQADGKTCDQEMIEVLHKLEPKIDSAGSHDPRWEMLEKLKKN